MGDGEPDPAAAAPGGRVRLQKLLASGGLASRRAAEQFLRQGRVTVNGVPAQLGDSADPAVDRVELDGEPIAGEAIGYWMLHKPLGVITTLSDPEGRRTVADLLPSSLPRVFPVGRLDVDTSGLLLLTNDGALAHALLHPSLGNEREYQVTVKGEVSLAVQRKLARGVRLEDGKTAPAQVERVEYDAARETTRLHLTLSEGRKRQIRRSLLALGHPVKRLVRVRMGPLRLGRLAKGGLRELRPDEVEALRAHAAQLAARKGGPGGGQRSIRGSRK